MDSTEASSGNADVVKAVGGGGTSFHGDGVAATTTQQRILDGGGNSQASGASCSTGKKGESDSAQVSEIISAEDLDSTSEEVESTISSSSNSGLHRRSRKLATMMSVDGNSSLLSAAAPESDGVQKVSEPKATAHSGMKHTQPASTPSHFQIRESPLSSDAIFNQSHAGLFNLCLVILIAVNSRLIIENLMKYGLLIQTGFWFSSRSLKDWPLLMCGLTLPVFPISALLVEKLKLYTPISEKFVATLYLIITTAGILYPGYVIHRVQSAVLSGLILILIAVTGWMKLVSYAHTNADVRALIKAGMKPATPETAAKVEYPENINFRNMAYFMMAPTLCYQLSYPKSNTVRKGWVLRQIGKLLVFVGLMGFITEQYINPTIKNSQHPLKGNPLYALERVLKLSIPTLYVWLCFFYCFFHLWLNIVAELMCFGDREFYKDWWNAKTVEEYWRMWNMPVHKWMVRHIYFPCLRAGLSKRAAVLVVFAISGIFHEVCIGVPCHMLRCWAFLGIMLQVPLVFLTNYLHKRFHNSMVGNMVFWFFFCIVGQPMCLLLYYHDVVNDFQTMSSSEKH
ncbi:unnamed protein product [Sphagnum troendelagicum]|uniref:O-acyltransferase n=1 Tax=Sphagnum jensenii TaxID=128206 RepID=A0ABP0WDA4_9BRYO